MSNIGIDTVQFNTTAKRTSAFAIVAAVNGDEVLRKNLLKSPLASRVPVILENNRPSAAIAYNSGLDKTDADYIIFVHQDVYLPEGWDTRLAAAIAQLEQANTPWAILGVWGIAAPGQYCGKVWCTGGGQQHAGQIGLREVVSLDEIVLVMNRKAGLRFDERLAGFHLFATDIILQGRAKGLKSFAFDGPVVHNSRANPQPLDKHYRNAYRFMQRKWKAQLPLITCVVNVEATTWPMWKQWLKNEIRVARGRFSPHPRLDDPIKKAIELGYESSPAGVAS